MVLKRYEYWGWNEQEMHYLTLIFKPSKRRLFLFEYPICLKHPKFAAQELQESHISSSLVSPTTLTFLSPYRANLLKTLIFVKGFWNYKTN